MVAESGIGRGGREEPGLIIDPWTGKLAHPAHAIRIPNTQEERPARPFIEEARGQLPLLGGKPHLPGRLPWKRLY